MSTTLAQLRTACYNIIKQPEDCTAYPYSLLDIFINKAQTDICTGTVTNMVTRKSTSKTNLSFLNKTSFFSSVQPTSLSTTTTIGSTSITVASTTGFLSSGAIWIQGNIVTYTGKTSTTFTGIPATGDGSIAFPWQSGNQIWQLYDLPTDFLQLQTVNYQASTSSMLQNRRMVGIDYRDIQSPSPNMTIYNFFRNDFSATSWTEMYYTLLNGAYFLPFIPANSYALRFEYVKKPTTLSVYTDTCTLPDTYSLSTIPYLATGEMLYNRGEGQEGMRLWDLGFEQVKTLFNAYNMTTKELDYNQKIRTSRNGLINI